MEGERPSLVYIAGYGRSGSTILDILLSVSADCWGGGELCWLFAEWIENRRCSCGQPLRSCSFWNQVFEYLRDNGFSWTWDEAAQITSHTQGISGRWIRGDDEAYRNLWLQTLRAIRSISGDSIIIDSSKSTRMSARRLGLLRDAGEVVAAVHLVRDPRSVMRSVRKGSNRKLEAGEPARLAGGGTRALLSWVATNVLFEASARRARSAYTRLRYEDLIADPAGTLHSVSEFVQTDVSEAIALIRESRSFIPGHAIAGNRMRRGNSVQLELHGQSLEQATKRDAWVSRVLPLMKKYGYS